MKIVHVTTVPETLRFFSGQISYMQSRGCEVHAVSSPGMHLDRFALEEDVAVHAIRMHRRITPFADLIALVRLIWLFYRLRPDIVHGHTPKGGLLSMIAASVARIPSKLFHVHGLPHSTASGVRHSVLAWATKTSCKLANHVLAVSNSVRDVVIAEGICPSAKIEVLLSGSSNGIDARTRFRPESLDARELDRMRQQYGLPADAVVIGFVGRFVRDKGLVELADAFISLQADRPTLHLLLVGDFESHDPLPEHISAMFRSHSRVHITGWLADVSPLYSLMDLLVLPSYREGFPNVLLEAAAMEIPVIATTAVGCRDAVEDGCTGRLIPAGDAAALRNAIVQYLEEPDERRAHARAGRLRVLEHFRPEPLWDALLGIYSRMCRRKTDSRSSGRRKLKRLLDLVLAGLALAMLWPLLLVLWVLIRSTIGSPVLFRQSRPGLYGEPFTMLKFRTMREAYDERGLILPDRDRLTGVGWWLRKFSLDELPALLNVLRGEMSLVGPRPLLMRYMPYFSDRERIRFTVPPGITGWAQVRGRNFSPWDKRFADDVWYVENWSLGLDLKILLLTIEKVLRSDDVAPDSYAAIRSLDEERSDMRSTIELVPQ